MKLRCKLIAGSDVEHLHQIYAGFAMLHRAGKIELTQEIPTEALAGKGVAGRWNDYRFFNTTVVVNDTVTVTYDTHDWAWIDPEILAKSDVYFKRSYLSAKIGELDGGNKVHPLGLNMQVNDSARDMFRMHRAKLYGGRDRLKIIIKSLRLDDLLGTQEVERLDQIEADPSPDLEPGVLYMARLWDPKSVESKKQSEAVEAMNESRVKSVRKLRKELGSRFFGGVSRDEYSAKYFSDALIEDGSLSQKRQYLQMLKGFPICVATVGLNGSNGWKLAEYVAASKAIITEPLVYEVPGDLEEGRNYLSFQNPDQLVTAANRLIEDREFRSGMMTNNQEYYRRYARPDAMIRNTLETASAALAG